MASFAKLDSDNIVIEVQSVVNEVLHDSNGVEQEVNGIDFLTNLTGWSNWVQTSYNTKRGVHSSGGTPLIKNHAGIGMTYDEDRDAFIAPKPFNSWVLNETTCTWKAPVAIPTAELEDGQRYSWKESIVNWEIKP